LDAALAVFAGVEEGVGEVTQESVREIAFIVVDSVFLEESAVFVLEAAGAAGWCLEGIRMRECFGKTEDIRADSW